MHRAYFSQVLFRILLILANIATSTMSCWNLVARYGHTHDAFVWTLGGLMNRQANQSRVKCLVCKKHILYDKRQWVLVKRNGKWICNKFWRWLSKPGGRHLWNSRQNVRVGSGGTATEANRTTTKRPAHTVRSYCVDSSSSPTVSEWSLTWSTLSTTITAYAPQFVPVVWNKICTAANCQIGVRTKITRNRTPTKQTKQRGLGLRKNGTSLSGPTVVIKRDRDLTIGCRE